MGQQTGAGASLAISAASPATKDAQGYGALTYIEIGLIEKIGAFGATFTKVEFQPLKGTKQKYKGSKDNGALQPNMALDSADAGQALLQTSADDESQKLYSMRVTYQDGSKRYFGGRTFGMPENVDGANNVVTAAPTIEICTDIVKVAAA